MLLKLWAFIALIALVASQESESSVYTVIAPSKLRPNIPFHVSASAHNVQKPLDMKIAIEGPADSGQYNNVEKRITLNSGETQILNFEIGEWSSGNYSLIVTGEGGMTFRNQTILTYEHKSYSVFIQTDKAIYKPGQLVQFRVLVVTPHLLPSVTGAINIFITDASGNRIKQWNRLFTTKGISSGELLLSEQPVLGDWTINVDVLGQMFKKSFTVAEYVLPNFEVQVSLPPYITYSKPEFVATVNAKYTYGKNVKGRVKLIVKPSLRYGYLANENKPVVTEAEIDGSIDIPVNVVRDLGLKEDTLTLEIDVIAEVEEYLTKRKYNASSVIKVYDKEIKIDVVKSAESFKPGLKYTAHLKVCYQDDTPVTVTNGDQIVLKYGYSYDERNWDSRRIAVPNNGLLSVDFFPPLNPNITSFGMSAEFRGYQYHLGNIEAAMSPSNSFIQVSLRTDNPTVDKEVELEINATEPLNQLVYEVLGRGDIVLAGAIDIPNVKSYRFSLPVSYKMAPKARVVVFYVRKENNEIVADAINFDVAGVFRTPVSVKADVKDTKPGGLVNVSVETKPNAVVGLLGIDQSVLLLKSGNDITQNDVITELETYDGGKKKKYWPYYRRKRSLWWPGSATAHDVFDDSGVVVLSNGLLYRFMPMIMYRSFRPEEDILEEHQQLDGDSMAYNSGSYGGKPRVRKHFPETWIWDLSPAGPDGKMLLSKKAPDTITSWIISAFAVDPVTGLGIAPDTTKVTVFRPFFVKLNLPYAIIRSESLYVEVIVFNYMKKTMKADVTLENRKGEFEFASTSNEVSVPKEMTKTVDVPAQDGVAVKFLITPKKLGYIDLKVTAQAENVGDAIVKKLLVKPEGSPQFFNKALLVDLRDPSSKKIDQTVKINVPGDAVPGSTSVMLSAIGDLLGPTVNNLDKLLRMPQGCGEQNMLNFVPNIVISKYLKRVNRLTPAIEKRSLHFMESGYQRELTYRRNDGSFSAFGNSDKNGSTWLTAFVVRSFHQAKEFMEIDEDIMSNSLEWLAKQQRADGSFGEPGEVHHKAMQGGSGSKSALTAYVLLAFLENQAQKTFGQEMDKASKYLSKELKNSKDPYFVSIVTYAFHLSEHSEKDLALQKLLSLSTRGVDTIHWQRKKDNSVDSYYTPQSQDVEMTAYALLTYSLRGDVAGSLPILRWLISRQNENGGYSSTQDTVVGIQALASLAFRLASTSISLNVSYSTVDTSNVLAINSENAMILQKVMLPPDTRSVKVQATGFGVGIIQVTWQYNIESTGKVPSFALKPVLGKASTDDYIELDICTKYTQEGASNMAVMEVGLPSGFQADSETFPAIKKLDKIKRIETQNGDTNVVIYFDRIDGNEMCVNVPAFRNHKVANQKPVPVKVYDYYDLAKSARMFYEPRVVDVCSLCESTDCPDTCNKVPGVSSSSIAMYSVALITFATIAVSFFKSIH
uniref:TEP1-F n=1 Tax=Hasarius adansoni TaxID=243517 RepID=G1UIC8_9ARAC|nr:thioester-containing protein [Hasarius adansoni]